MGLWVYEVGWCGVRDDRTLMKWDSSHVSNHCFSLLCSVQPVLSNLKTKKTGTGRQFPSTLQLKGFNLPFSVPPQGNYLTREMVWWNPCIENRKSRFLILLPQILHCFIPLNDCQANFTTTKPSLIWIIRQIFLIAKRSAFFLIHFHLSTHSHTCLYLTGVGAQTGAIWRRTGGKLTNRAELAAESRVRGREEKKQVGRRKK